MWCSATPDIPPSTEKLVTSVLAKLPVVDRLRTLAAQRVAYIWEVVKEGECKHGPSPPEATVWYYTGLIVDTHMALLWHPKSIMLHEVYTLGLAPDQVRANQVANDFSYPLPRESIERLWKVYLTRAPLKPLIKSKPRKKKVLTKKKKRRKRKRDESESTDSLFTRTEMPPENQIHLTVTQTLNDYVKIIEKGMPRSITARSIKSLLEKTVQKQPLNNVAIVNMVRQFVVGAYKTAVVVAPPAIRVMAYAPSTEFLMSIISRLENKHMYTMVAEYVIGMARSIHTLDSVLVQNTEWRAYCKQAHTVCNYHIRRLVVNRGLKPTKGNKIRQGFQQTLTTASILWILAEVLGVKRHLQKADLDAARILVPNMAVVYYTFAKQCNDMRLYGALLEEVGVPKVDLATIENTFQMLRPNDIADQFKEMKQRMSTGGAAILKLYVHRVLHAATFRIIPIRIQRPPVNFRDRVIPCILVCPCCLVTRSQVHDVKKFVKARDGVEVDTIRFSVTCTACGTDGMKMVDLRHNRVMSLNVNDMSTPALTCLCRMCGRLTRYKNVIGVDEVCEPCFQTACKTVRPRRCICGVEFTTKNKSARTFVALNAEGTTCLYALCKKHQGVLKHACRPDHSITFYLKLIKR